MYLSLFFVLCISLFINPILCYVPLKRANHNSVIIDNRLLIFGGVKNITLDLLSYAFELFYLDLSVSFDVKNVSWALIPEGNSPPYSSHSTTVVGLDNSTIFQIGGFIFNKNTLNYDFSNLVFTYDYPTGKWDTPSITGDIPPRQLVRGVINNKGIIYMFGGYNATNITESEYIGTFYNDMYILNTKTMTLSLLSILGNLPSRCGAYSANILPNGIIIYIGGTANTTNATTTPININNIRLFDTNKYEWSQMNATGETIDSRWFHTSVLTTDGYIIVFGGCTFEGKFSYTYSVSPNLAVLDTNKNPFEWSIPESSKINSPPSMCSHAANLYYNYMIVTFGFLIENNSTFINSTFNSDVYIYDITSNSWVTSYTAPDISKSIKKSSKKALAIGLGTGVAVIFIILILIGAFIFYKKRGRILRVSGSA
ncbi:hypothetical protein Glove_461g42 [Diversispora epigaea]|uniref:Galactose oxidase n=1 Tax=Diversispora epigaea TaxID=1348612 RepID=A0A397GN34_9GLOM|nr:hypothetical protein Glove_461g42 [Diversispora epigaea]